MMRPVMKQECGFTLVEAIITIVMIGVLAGVVAVFIRAPMQNYADSAARAEMSDAADLALRRIGRDLRSALPNSIRVIGSDGHGIEFIPTKTGGRYLSASDGDADGITRFALDFADPSKLSFTVVGASPDFLLRAKSADYVVVYNLGAGFNPADAWTGGNRALIDTVTTSGGIVKITMKNNNTFGQQSPPMQSPSQRFQVVGQPVSYYCGSENGVLTLRRYWNYGFSPSASNTPPSGASTAVVASRLNSCSGLFSYDGNLGTPGSAANRRSGLVTLAIALQSRNDTAATIRLAYQVHVDNTP